MGFTAGRRSGAFFGAGGGFAFFGGGAFAAITFVFDFALGFARELPKGFDGDLKGMSFIKQPVRLVCGAVYSRPSARALHLKRVIVGDCPTCPQ